MAMVSARRFSEFEAPYTKIVHDLCWQSSGAYGGLHGILGPLRSDSNQKTGLRYRLEHERDSFDMDFFGDDMAKRSSRIRAFNLDFTLPTVVRVFGDEQRQAMPISGFVTELLVALGEEEIDEHGVLAISAGIRAEHEGKLLKWRQGDLKERSARFAGKSVTKVDDVVLKELALDVALRQANLNLINSEVRDHIRAAHNIAAHYPGTADEMMTDQALRAITRPDQEFGQFAMDPETASAILRGTSRTGAIGE